MYWVVERQASLWKEFSMSCEDQGMYGLGRYIHDPGATKSGTEITHIMEQIEKWKR